MIAAIVCLSALQAPGSTVYVQATSARLRAEANAQAALVAELPIATMCTQLQPTQNDWAKVDCGGKVGYAKSEFLADSRPKLDALKALSEKEDLAPAERLTALTRAIALAAIGTQEERGSLGDLSTEFRPRLFAAELQRLTQARTSGKTLKKPRVVRTRCNVINYNQCFGKLTPTAEFHATQRSEGGADFVHAALLPDGKMQVVSGASDESTFDLGQIAGVDLTFTVELEYTASPDLPTLQALVSGDGERENQLSGVTTASGCSRGLWCASDARGFADCQACVNACAGTCRLCGGATSCGKELATCVAACRKRSTAKPGEDFVPAIAACNAGELATRLRAETRFADDKDAHARLLPLAARCPGPDVLQALLSAGADPQARAENGTTALFKLIEEINDKPTPQENLALLVSKTSDLEASDASRTLLSMATLRKSLPMVQLLLARGANANAVIPRSKGMSALFMAPNPAIAEALIAAGANVNAADELGWTPVLAADVGAYPALKAHGANLKVVTSDGWTTLIRFTRDGFLPGINDALAAGVPLQQTTQDGYTALIEAARHCRADLVKVLLAAGADPNFANRFGRTALHEALEAHDQRFSRTSPADADEVIRLLLAAKANPNAVNKRGEAPLHLAVASSLSHVKLLLEAGADPTVRDAKGKLPVDLATSAGKQDVVELLQASAVKEKR